MPLDRLYTRSDYRVNITEIYLSNPGRSSAFRRLIPEERSVGGAIQSYVTFRVDHTSDPDPPARTPVRFAPLASGVAHDLVAEPALTPLGSSDGVVEDGPHPGVALAGFGGQGRLFGGDGV